MTGVVQAAQQSGGVFTLAVSVTRPTHDDSPRPTGAEPPDVTWLQGRINPEMVSKVSLLISFDLGRDA